MSHRASLIHTPAPTPHSGQPPTTHGATLIGWLVICFAVIPLAMWGAGDGSGYALGGLVMVGAGAGLVAHGRLAITRSGGRQGA